MEETDVDGGHMLIKERALPAQVAVGLRRDRALLQGPHLCGVGKESADFAQPFSGIRIFLFIIWCRFCAACYIFYFFVENRLMRQHNLAGVNSQLGIISHDQPHLQKQPAW